MVSQCHCCSRLPCCQLVDVTSPLPPFPGQKSTGLLRCVLLSKFFDRLFSAVLLLSLPEKSEEWECDIENERTLNYVYLFSVNDLRGEAWSNDEIQITFIHSWSLLDACPLPKFCVSSPTLSWHICNVLMAILVPFWIFFLHLSLEWGFFLSHNQQC